MGLIIATTIECDSCGGFISVERAGEVGYPLSRHGNGTAYEVRAMPTEHLGTDYVPESAWLCSTGCVAAWCREEQLRQVSKR